MLSAPLVPPLSTLAPYQGWATTLHWPTLRLESAFLVGLSLEKCPVLLMLTVQSWQDLTIESGG